jgi:hypothetical protein
MHGARSQHYDELLGQLIAEHAAQQARIADLERENAVLREEVRGHIRDPYCDLGVGDAARAAAEKEPGDHG